MSRILVIDDSPSALETIAMILVGAGHQVTTCADGNRAIQMLRTEAFDLIVTDIYMPHRDGLELIREGGRICPAVPIVAISGKTGPWNMLHVAQYLGACQTVQKPFCGADLLEGVRRALSMALPDRAVLSPEHPVADAPHPIGGGRQESIPEIRSHEDGGAQE